VQASPLGEVSFQFHDGFIWLRVSTPGTGQPLNFLLDTGASVSVVDINVARHLGLKLGECVSVTGVNSITTGYWPEKLTATLDGISLAKSYLGVDLAKLGEACSMPVDGLLGMDFFAGKTVQIDFDCQTIRILDAEVARQIQGEILPLEMGHSGMRVPVVVNGNKPQWMRLDTGCGSALQWVTSGTSPQKCTQRIAVALKEFSIPSTIVDVSLGKVVFKNVPTGVSAKAIFPGEDGLLGDGLLARFAQVTIDTKRRRLVLSHELNSHFAAPRH
jgi:predicted aspartyl protease